ncbi:hypothetical protein M758_5G101700 [Ceratodon purpureus]|nr:hypothetical protein M758_5G101700 [Ceratodon purpureus]
MQTLITRLTNTQAIPSVKGRKTTVHISKLAPYLSSAKPHKEQTTNASVVESVPRLALYVLNSKLRLNMCYSGVQFGGCRHTMKLQRNVR